MCQTIINKEFPLLLLMVFVYILISFSSSLSAQNTQEDRKLVTFQDIKIQSESSHQIQIEVQFSTPLKPGAKLSMALMNAVNHFKVDEKIVTISSKSSQRIIFGTYSNLWKSSYFIHCRYQGTFKEDLSSVHSQSTPSRTMNSSLFTIHKNVPPPEVQKKTFRNKLRMYYTKYYQFISWFYPRAREYRQKLLYENRRNQLSGNIEQFITKAQKRIETLSAKTTNLQEEHVLGSPFQSEIRKVKQFHNRLAKQVKLSAKYLSSFYEDEISKSKRRAFIDKFTNKRDQLLYKLADQFLSFNQPSFFPDHPAKNVLRKQAINLSLQLNALFSKITSRNERRLQKLQIDRKSILKALRTSKERMNNILWLFRNRNTLARNEQEAFKFGKRFIQLFRDTEKVISQNQLTIKTFKRLKKIYKRVNEPLNTPLKEALKQIVAHYEKELFRLRAVASGTSSDRQEKIKVSLDHLDQYSKNWSPFLDRIQSFLNNWSSEPGKKMNDTIFQVIKTHNDLSQKEMNKIQKQKKSFSSWLRNIEKIQNNLAAISKFTKDFQRRLKKLQKKESIYRSPYEKELSWVKRNIHQLQIPK